MKALLINRLQVQGGADMTQTQFGVYCVTHNFQATTEPIPSLSLQQGEQLTKTLQ